MRKAAKKVVKGPAAAATTSAWEIPDKALKELEKALGHFQKQNYAEALERFQAIHDGFGQEKELLDRVQVYIRICKNMVDRKSAQPKRPEDFFYFGVMKANEADYEKAVEFLGRALEADPKDEKTHYVMASTLALKGDRQQAMEHLRQAVDLNATNRIYARNDPDFEPLRDDETFQNLIHPEEA